MVNLPSLISLTNFATVGAAPHSPSMLFGKLDASRHLIAGCCAMAGEATATAEEAAARRAKLRRDTAMAVLPRRRTAARFAPALAGNFGGCRRRSLGEL